MKVKGGARDNILSETIRDRRDIIVVNNISRFSFYAINTALLTSSLGVIGIIENNGWSNSNNKML